MNERGTEPVRALGVDAGTSLVKLAARGADGAVRHVLEPTGDLDALAERIASYRAGQIGLCGGGAGALAARLGRGVRVGEFDAWARGADELLAQQGAPPDGRHLLVSMGTGTSVLLTGGGAVTRVGGTALGGGTFLGLGRALLGGVSFDELVALAARGSRRNADLRLADVYGADIPAALGEFTASNFGRLARPKQTFSPPAREDLAHALAGLVGENVALLCAALAAAHDVRSVVYGGTLLRENAPLVEILRAVTAAHGLGVTLLRGGEFAGALGALRVAEAAG